MAIGFTNISTGGGVKNLTASPEDVKMGLTFSRDGKTAETGTMNLTNLLPENIRQGVNIAGVVGEYDNSLRILPRSKQLTSTYGSVSFTVPENTYKVQCLLIGSGGTGYYGGNIDKVGGNGWVTFAEFNVVPSQILTGEYSGETTSYHETHADGYSGVPTKFNGAIAPGGSAGTKYSSGGIGDFSPNLRPFKSLFFMLLSTSTYKHNARYGKGVSSGYPGIGAIFVFY